MHSAIYRTIGLYSCVNYIKDLYMITLRLHATVFYLRSCGFVCFPKPEFAFLSVWLGTTTGVGQTCHFKQSFGCLHFFLRWRPILATGNFGIYVFCFRLLAWKEFKKRESHSWPHSFTFLIILNSPKVRSNDQP